MGEYPTDDGQVSAPSAQLRVAVVDDNKNRRESLRFTLEDVGLEPVLIGSTASIEEAVRTIHDSADAAVCDHRLSKNSYAPFTGAELVAALYSRGIPAVLITAFQDDDFSIRAHRQRIPRLLVGDDAGDGDLLKVAISSAVDEVTAGNVPPDRQAHTSFLRIEYIEEEAGKVVVYGFVPQWSEDSGIKFPLDLVPEAMRDDVEPGKKLLADVNTGAAERKDVFLTNFAPSPEPADDDSLA